jgi:hypothetical protein
VFLLSLGFWVCGSFLCIRPVYLEAPYVFIKFYVTYLTKLMNHILKQIISRNIDSFQPIGIICAFVLHVV